MIRSEAIFVLNNLRNYYSNRQGGEENAQALDFAISSLLTDEAQPIIHAKWTPEGGCSNCKYVVAPWNIGVNYCPNCGAKMDEEQNEDATNTTECDKTITANSIQSKLVEAINNGIPFPKVYGRLLVLSEECVKEHMLCLDTFQQKFIGEVDLSNAIVGVIEADKENKDVKNN